MLPLRVGCRRLSTVGSRCFSSRIRLLRLPPRSHHVDFRLRMFWFLFLFLCFLSFCCAGLGCVALFYFHVEVYDGLVGYGGPPATFLVLPRCVFLVYLEVQTTLLRRMEYLSVYGFAAVVNSVFCVVTVARSNLDGYGTLILMTLHVYHSELFMNVL